MVPRLSDLHTLAPEAFKAMQALQTTELEIEGGRVTRICITRNPEKLRHVVSLLGLETTPGD